MLVAVIAAASLAGLPGTAARADAGNSAGSGGDGSLQLIPEVITNSGISAGGSAEFPVKAQLFLPVMQHRAQDRRKAEAAITEAISGIGFQRQVNPLFTHDFSKARNGLFADYAPQTIPTARTQSDTQSNDLWSMLMVGAAIPLVFLAVFLGGKNASRRRKRHARATP